MASSTRLADMITTTNLPIDMMRGLIVEGTREVTDVVPTTMPLVSVALIVFNHAMFIRQAIDSILSQKSDFLYEIVIGDDCSTDGTTKILLEYQQRHPDRIRVLLAAENFGRYTGNGRLNFVRTLEACRGKYIAILEGDDYWTSPDKLQKQVQFLEAHPSYTGSCHRTQVIELDGSFGRIYGSRNRPDVDVLDTLAVSAPWHTSSFVLRHEHLEMPAWFWSVVSADMAMFTIIAAKGAIRAIPEVMSVYRKHPAGVTSTNYVLSTFHEKRIELMEHLDQYLQGRYHHRIEVVKAHHRAALDQRSSLLPHSWARRIRQRMLSLAQRWRRQHNGSQSKQELR